MTTQDPALFQSCSPNRRRHSSGSDAPTAGSRPRDRRLDAGRIACPPQRRQRGGANNLNCLSALQFAVDVLKVKHVIVCGHYDCSDIRATLDNDRLGLTDNWRRHVQDVRKKYAMRLGAIAQNDAHCDKLCELNVVEQAVNVCETTIVQDAWAHGQRVSVHGWIYGLRDGRLHELGIRVAEREQHTSIYDAAIEGLLRI